VKKFYAHFEAEELREVKSGLNCPLTYNFWPLLISFFIRKCDVFHIDCWIDEIEGIESAERYGQDVENSFDNIKSFEGKITKEFIEEILKNPFDQDGKIKWFSVSLKNGDERIISCDHYGREFVTGWLKSKDADYIRTIIQDDFTFHIFRS
jgi:hypothetical protein